MRANREFELIIRRASPGLSALADRARLDQVEVFEIASGEVALFWDTPPSLTGRLSRALKSDLAQLEGEQFLRRWRSWEPLVAQDS